MTPEELKELDDGWNKFLKGRTTEEYFRDMLDEAIKEAEAKEKKP
ncbi:MAG: hypothetical protein ACFWTZ_04095 [Burkholderia sp.]|jgi:hypothetical protein